jgi:hypothetical protein
MLLWLLRVLPLRRFCFVISASDSSAQTACVSKPRNVVPQTFMDPDFVRKCARHFCPLQKRFQKQETHLLIHLASAFKAYTAASFDAFVGGDSHDPVLVLSSPQAPADWTSF